MTGAVAPPVLAGRLPRAPGEIALGGRELRALHKHVGDLTTAQGAHGPAALHIVGQVVLSPEITNEQAQLGSGAVMTLAAPTGSAGSDRPAMCSSSSCAGTPTRRPSPA